MEMVSTLVF